MRFVGHRTILENHIGDWGRQFGMLIEHLLDIGETEAAHELSVSDLNTFYREASTKFEASEEFKDRAAPTGGRATEWRRRDAAALASARRREHALTSTRCMRDSVCC